MHHRVHWTSLMDQKDFKIYKTTGTPCSCWLYRGESYDRRKFHKNTQRIIKKSYIELVSEDVTGKWEV